MNLAQVGLLVRVCFHPLVGVVSVVCFLLGAAPCLVWIVSHSYVYWSGARSDARPVVRPLRDEVQ